MKIVPGHSKSTDNFCELVKLSFAFKIWTIKSPESILCNYFQLTEWVTLRPVKVWEQNTILGGMIFYLFICFNKKFLGTTKFSGEQNNLRGNVPECPSPWLRVWRDAQRLMPQWTTAMISKGKEDQLSCAVSLLQSPLYSDPT